MADKFNNTELTLIHLPTDIRPKHGMETCPLDLKNIVMCHAV